MTRPLPIPSRTSHLPARVSRQVDGELARIEGGLAIARAAYAAPRATGSVTEDALVATARLSTVESLAIETAPHAEGRLKLIADAGAVGLLAVINDVAGSMSCILTQLFSSEWSEVDSLIALQAIITFAVLSLFYERAHVAWPAPPANLQALAG